MLSYLHGYHAGNQADLHKHAVLAALLATMTQNAAPMSYIETHAGAGLYDLGGAEARKTGEAAAGIGRLRIGRPADPYFGAIAAARARFGPDAYPGSPWIARRQLRACDRIWLFELHPREHPALRRHLRAPNVRVARRDGFAGALALAPPMPRRGLVFIDPSYEVKDEYGRTADFIAALLRVWPGAAVLLWYPLLPDDRHAPMTAALLDLLPPRLQGDERRFPPIRERGLTGSGLLLLNAPEGFDLARAGAQAAEAAGRAAR